MGGAFAGAYCNGGATASGGDAEVEGTGEAWGPIKGENSAGGDPAY